jgi:hypothetical protein
MVSSNGNRPNCVKIIENVPAKPERHYVGSCQRFSFLFGYSLFCVCLIHLLIFSETGSTMTQ